jgi:hypothetical protein
MVLHAGEGVSALDSGPRGEMRISDSRPMECTISNPAAPAKQSHLCDAFRSTLLHPESRVGNRCFAEPAMERGTAGIEDDRKR